MDDRQRLRCEKLVFDLHWQGKDIQTSVDQLDPFPVDSFAQLVQGIKDKSLEIRNLTRTVDMTLFNLLASNGDALLNRLSVYLMFAAPILAFAGGLLFSWWWLAALPLTALGYRGITKTYNRTIYQAAIQSESAFCLLYSVKRVWVLDVKNGIHYYYRQGDDVRRP